MLVNWLIDLHRNSLLQRATPDRVRMACLRVVADMWKIMALAFPMFTVGPFLWKKPVGFVIKETDRREEECDIVWISFESLLEYGNAILRLTRFSLLLCLFLPIPLKGANNLLFILSQAPVKWFIEQ